MTEAWAQAAGDTAPITTATTQASGTPAGAVQEPSAIAGLMPLILIAFIFYFMMIRPQQKRLREHQDMIKSIQKGDRAVTSGGILGKVVRVDSDSIVSVEIAEGVTVQVSRPSITSVLDKNGEAKKPIEDVAAAPAPSAQSSGPAVKKTASKKKDKSAA